MGDKPEGFKTFFTQYAGCSEGHIGRLNIGPSQGVLKIANELSRAFKANVRAVTYEGQRIICVIEVAYKK